MRRIVPFLFVLLIALPACGLPAPTPTQAPISPETAPPAAPISGMWMNDTETYVFTETSLYHVIVRAENGQVNEEFSEIVSCDTANNRITLLKKWIRVNGKPAGFDEPSYTLIYSINGDSLQLGLGTATEFATELDPAVFARK